MRAIAAVKSEQALSSASRREARAPLRARVVFTASVHRLQRSCPPEQPLLQSRPHLRPNGSLYVDGSGPNAVKTKLIKLGGWVFGVAAV
jgi:hypothetical protein